MSQIFESLRMKMRMRVENENESSHNKMLFYDKGWVLKIVLP